jgi:heptosyltransferase-2
MGSKILAIKMRALGDSVIATAALQFLASKGTVDFAVPAAAAPLMQNAPYLDQIIAIDEPRGLLSKIYFWIRVIFELRKNRYKYIAVFHGSYKIAIIARLVAGLGGRVSINHHKLNGGFIHRWMIRLLNGRTRIKDFGRLKPNLERDLDCAQALFPMEVVDSLPHLPHLHVTDTERAWAEERLHQRGFKKDAPLYFLGVGASKSTKRWPIQHFEKLIQNIKAQYPNAHFVVAAIKSDQDWLAHWWHHPPSNVLVFRDHDLRQVMALISHCQVYVGNDSGMKHVAVALGLPTVTIFGPEDPVEWHPYNKKNHPYFFIEPMPCRTASGRHWCSLNHCVVEKNRCMTEVSADLVTLAVRQVISANS